MKTKIVHCTSIFFAAILLFFLLNLKEKSYALDAGWTITAPGSVFLPAVSWSLNQQQTTISFPSDIVISNSSSTANGFTARVTSTEFLHNTDQTLFIGYVKLEMQTGTVTTDQPAGISTPLNGVFTFFSGVLTTSDPLNFMIADVRNRNPGSWSITPTLRLTIPAKQKAGTYNATLTFSLV